MSKYSELAYAVRALVAALPECLRCSKPATHGMRDPEYCEAHAKPSDVELPFFDPLRDVVALLGNRR